MQHLDESPENYAEWKKTISKGYRLSDFVCIKVLNWQNYKNGEHICGCHRLKRRWGQKVSVAISVTWGIFVVMEIVFILTISISESWLWYCYHWGKLGNGYMESLCILFHNFVWIYNDLKKFSLKHVYRDTHFPFCLRLQYGSEQHCLALERPCILALLDLPRTELGYIVWLKTELCWEIWVLNTCSLPTLPFSQSFVCFRTWPL